MNQVTDQDTLKKYKELPAKMIDTIGKHKNLFSDIEFKHRNYLCLIPDPATTAPPPLIAASSRDISVERSTSHPKQNYDHLKPPTSQTLG